MFVSLSARHSRETKQISNAKQTLQTTLARIYYCLRNILVWKSGTQGQRKRNQKFLSPGSTRHTHNSQNEAKSKPGRVEGSQSLEPSSLLPRMCKPWNLSRQPELDMESRCPHTEEQELNKHINFLTKYAPLKGL